MTASPSKQDAPTSWCMMLTVDQAMESALEVLARTRPKPVSPMSLFRMFTLPTP